LRRFEPLERGRDFAFDRAMGTSEMGDDRVLTQPSPKANIGKAEACGP